MCDPFEYFFFVFLFYRLIQFVAEIELKEFYASLTYLTESFENEKNKEFKIDKK